MPEISLTDFVDFAIKTPPCQLTKVYELIKRGSYNPQFDFWKLLRESIQDHHRSGKSLDGVLPGLKDPKKVARYTQAVKAYKQFLKKQKELSWFKPPSAAWQYGGLVVRVNPELGLSINGQEFAVKLYFKDEKPTNQRLRIVFELMRIALKLNSTVIPCVLDVSAARLISPKSGPGNLLPLLEAQALAFDHLWKAIAPKEVGAGA